MAGLATARRYVAKNQAEVVSTEDVGDGLVRVRATVKRVDAGWQPGQAVAVIADPAGATMKDRWRHYTLRRYDADGTLEFLIVDRQADTPGGRFLQRVRDGEAFTFMGPGGKPVLRHGAGSYLFVGDRTSVASIAAMIDALPPEGPSIEAVVATPNPEAASLDVERKVGVRWVEASSADDIRARTLASLPCTIPVGTQAYVTGEMETMRAVRKALSARGIGGRRSIGAHAHWTPSRRGM